ncbi:MAG: DUF4124 domain-containing protein [Desulfosarcinaceae bacterium]
MGILIFFSLFAGSASAEFYRYVDGHGNVLYTDDLSKVPPDQRKGIQSYEAFEPKPEPIIKEEKAVQETNNEKDKQARQKLLEQQASLNKEYDQLMVERSKLNGEKDKAVTTAQIKEYNKLKKFQHERGMSRQKSPSRYSNKPWPWAGRPISRSCFQIPGRCWSVANSSIWPC